MKEHLCIANKHKQMKKTITAIAILLLGFSAQAQNANSGASQTANLSLSNAIDITFTGSGANIGNSVAMAFNSVNDYANGIYSGDQEIKVRSNRRFKVTVKSSSSKFSYSGSTTPAPQMPVQNVLKVKVTANNTGGTAGSFGTSYKTLKSSSQTLINNASNGGDKTFAVKYLATPGFAYPAGNYSVDVIYTATQY